MRLNENGTSAASPIRSAPSEPPTLMRLAVFPACFPLSRPACFPLHHCYMFARRAKIAELLNTKTLPKNGAPYQHFKKAIGEKGQSVVRCSLVKHTSCRVGKCAVKKHVKCLSVCPLKKTGNEKNKNSLKNKNIYVGANTPDCGNDKINPAGWKQARELYQGHYMDEQGKRQSYGALACSQWR